MFDKKQKLTQCSFSITREQADKITKLAKKHGISINSIARGLITAGLETAEMEKK